MIVDDYSTSNNSLTSFYTKNWEKLVNALNHYYSQADREDAVQSVFVKVMSEFEHKKPEGILPETETELLYYIFNRARAHLSHMRVKRARRARIEIENAEDLAYALGYVRSDDAARTAEYSRALPLALDMAHKDGKVSKRDRKIFLAITTGKETVPSASRRYGVTEGNTYKIVCCVKKVLRDDSHGPNYLARALNWVRNGGSGLSAA